MKKLRIDEKRQVTLTPTDFRMSASYILFAAAVKEVTEYT